MKSAYHLTTNCKSQITNLSAICANGNTLPQMIIYPGKTINPSVAVDLPSGSLAYATSSRWINTDAFVFWLRNLFLPNLTPIRPVLLLVDGHTSHLDLEVAKLMRENNIEIFCLLPHTINAVQPLDVGVFGPAKK